MNVAGLLFALVLISSYCYPIQGEEQQVLSRHKRFLGNFFNFFQVQNVECESKLPNLNGTCYSQTECLQKKGTPSGSCQGSGVCCVFVKSCHNRTDSKSILFTNPSYPGLDTAALHCELTVEVKEKDVCQIRVDFETFMLDQPVDGACEGDVFRIFGLGTPALGIGSLCGNNSGQHIYLDVAQSFRPQAYTLVFVTSAQGDYTWRTRITQIDCKNDDLQLQAPRYCAQYYKGMTNTIESLNFGSYTINQDYKICIKREESTCSVKYSADLNDWGIDSNVSDKSKSAVGTTECSLDYVILERGSEDGMDPSEDRYCGGVLAPSPSGKTTPGTIISQAKGPISIRFHTDESHDDTKKQGFRIKYEQLITGC